MENRESAISCFRKMPGPRKKPSAIEDLQGRPGHRPRNNNEPKPELSSEVPTAPDWLDAEGKSWWAKLAPVLHGVRILTVADLKALAQYCDITSRWMACRARMEKEPDSKNENVIYRNLIGLMQRYEGVFGLNPSSRTGLSVPADDKKTSPLEAFIKPRGNLN